MNSGLSHLFLESGASNLIMRASRVVSAYLSSFGLARFQLLTISTVESHCTIQCVVLTCFEIQ